MTMPKAAFPRVLSSAIRVLVGNLFPECHSASNGARLGFWLAEAPPESTIS